MNFSTLFSKAASSGLSAGLTGGVSSLVGLGTNLLIGGIKSLFGRSDAQKQKDLMNEQARLNYEYTSKLMGQQHDYNVSDFYLQNEYNSPVNQRSRLEAAGINPAMMGTSNTTTLGISPTSASGYSPVDYSSVVQASQQERLIDAQISNLRSQSNLTNQQAKNVDIKNDYEALIGSNTVTLLGTQIKLNEKLTESEAQKIAESKSRVDTTVKEAQARIDNLRKQTDNIEFEQLVAASYLQLETVFKQSQIDSQAQALALKEIETLTGVSVAEAEIALKRSQKRLNNASADYQENVNNQEFDYDFSLANGNLYRTRQVSALNSVDLGNQYQKGYNKAYLPTLRRRAESELKSVDLGNAKTAVDIATQTSEALRKWVPLLGLQ